MKRIASLLLAILLMLCFCACGTQVDFAYVHCYEEDAYTTALAESFSDTARQLGYTCKVVRPEDPSADSQAELIEQLIREGVRGIALNSNQQEGLEDILEEAQDNGIPVITVSRDTAGSDLLIQPSSPELVGASLMDAMLELSGGEGEFVVISGETPFSGSDPWVSGMKAAAGDNKYETLSWLETNYSYNLNSGIAGMKTLVTSLMDKYPNLRVICCPGVETLAFCSQAIEELDVPVQVTGLSQPVRMEGLVGEDRACPYFFLWNPHDIGACAAYALEALVTGASLKNAILTTDLGEYTLYTGGYADFYIYAGPPFRFTDTPIY